MPQKSWAKIFICAAFCMLVLPAAVFADDVADAVAEASASYRAADFSRAAENIEYARALILQEKSAVLESFMPKPKPGWEVLPTRDGFGRGASATRVYQKGRSMMSLTISTDVPKEEKMPFEEESPCARMWEEERAKMPVIDIGRHKARVYFENRSGSMTIEEGSMNIEIRGDGVSKEELVDMLNAIDIDAIASMK